ncbi:MAG: hypothetical protein E6Q97_05320 [Desulfurellales bacterium]|nr:MAG: hypothetical protein E6Q97_05320 [Desulfurellales bacterium]
MTKTPFDEFLEAAFGPGARLVAVEITPAILSDRTSLVKALWQQAILDAPLGALDGPDGLILQLDDPTTDGGHIVYERITYGTKSVIEAEGVVVCHLIG